MPRNMSFMLTTAQYRARTKTVTRRLGWAHLKPGDVFNGVEKAMGLKKGERVNKLGTNRCLSTRWEPLNAITPEDVVREGFPEMTPTAFVAMFCQHNKCAPDELVNRIEYEYLDEAAEAAKNPATIAAPEEG